MNMNKLQHMLKVMGKILIHFPMWVISMLCQMVSFVMLLFFFVTLISLVTGSEMGNILQQLVGLSKGLSICIVLVSSMIIGVIFGGIAVAIEEYLCEHK